jgi:hypothetical protein
MQGAGGIGGLIKVTDYVGSTTHHFVAYDGNGNVGAFVDAGSAAITARYSYGLFPSPKPLDQSVSSWVYKPGLRSDDPGDIAILWEAKPGLYYDGRRNNIAGHAVLLISGEITNVAGTNWEKFLKYQDSLRTVAQSKRGRGN